MPLIPMRRHRFPRLVVLLATLVIPAVARGQGFFIRQARTPRAWLVVSDGVGLNGGGLANTSGFVQLFRASGTLAITATRGVEVTALRIQELLPSKKLLNDPSLNNPSADGLLIALASLKRDGANGGFSASTVIGGGVMRRPTNDPFKKRLTYGIEAGIESSLWKPPLDWVDATGGARLILMPAAGHGQLYIIALTFGLRFG